MKRSKKLMAVLMTAILGTAVFLTGCGEKPAGADVTVKAFYNLYILGDSTEIEKVGLSKDDAKKVLDEIKTKSQALTKNNITKAGFEVTDAELDAIFEAQMEALKKLTPTTEIVSEDGDKATVKLTTNFIDMLAADIDAGEEAQSETEAMGLTNTEEINNKFIELYKSKLVKFFKAAEPAADKNVETFECEKKTYDVDGKNKEIYTPKDMEEFGQTIALMTTGKQ